MFERPEKIEKVEELGAGVLFHGDIYVKVKVYGKSVKL